MSQALPTASGYDRSTVDDLNEILGNEAPPICNGYVSSNEDEPAVKTKKTLKQAGANGFITAPTNQFKDFGMVILNIINIVIIIIYIQYQM